MTAGAGQMLGPTHVEGVWSVRFDRGNKHSNGSQ